MENGVRILFLAMHFEEVLIAFINASGIGRGRDEFHPCGWFFVCRHDCGGKRSGKIVRSNDRSRANADVVADEVKIEERLYFQKLSTLAVAVG